LPPGPLLLDIAGPAEVLRLANSDQSRVRLEVSYHSPAPSTMTSAGLTLAELMPLPGELEDDAMVIVSGDASSFMSGSPGPSMELDKALIVQWLRRSVRPSHLLVCICSGSLFAAKAGLLDGYACTTHHSDCAELAKTAPQARVMDNCLFVQDRRRWTSAGVTTGVDLMLHLVGEIIDPLCALRIARHLVIYMRRSGGESQASPWFAQRNHVHPAVHRVQDAIAARPETDWSVEALAGIAGTSTRHLSRLFREHVGSSVPGYLSRTRVGLAAEFLRRTSLDLEHVADRVGFASTRQLRRVWAQYFPYPPSEIRRRRETHAPLLFTGDFSVGNDGESQGRSDLQ
jgi:transcriptional regulator GlxA family with amidase domain